MIPGRALNDLCAAGGVDPKHVYEVEVTPSVVTFFLYSQHNGRPYWSAGKKDLARHWVSAAIDWSDK